MVTVAAGSDKDASVSTTNVRGPRREARVARGGRQLRPSSSTFTTLLPLPAWTTGAWTGRRTPCRRKIGEGVLLILIFSLKNIVVT